MCVCVRERERKRESEFVCVCVCVCVCLGVHMHHYIRSGSTNTCVRVLMAHDVDTVASLLPLFGVLCLTPLPRTLPSPRTHLPTHLHVAGF